MISIFHRHKLNKYSTSASAYVKANYCPPDPNPIRYSAEPDYNSFPSQSDVKFSDRGVPSEILEKDHYDASSVSRVMTLLQEYRNNSTQLSQALSVATAQTFSECFLAYMRQKGLKDSTVYKAAHIDRRLYSKIVSNKDYRPGRDTVIALAFALKLSLSQAEDLLKRAGFTLSHSNKRDVIIEYFFREEVYNLNDINAVLDMLGEKMIGH